MRQGSCNGAQGIGKASQAHDQAGAATIYEGRAFDRMRDLADALERAGCDDGELIRHCRTEGQHVRGCWAIDLNLQKR